MRGLRAAVAATFATVLVSVFLAGPAAAEDAWSGVGDPIKGTTAGNQFGKAVSLSNDGMTMAVGNDPGALNSGDVRIYDWDGDSWEQRGSTITGGAITRREYGTALSLSGDGNILAIGDPLYDAAGTERGLVQVWEWNGTAWTQRGSNIVATTDYQYFGGSVSLSDDGTTVAIGAPGSSLGPTPQGLVQIHTWDGTSWLQRGADILAPAGGTAGDLFGWSVSITGDGSLVAVSTYISLDKVWTFEWNGTSWGAFGGALNFEASAATFSSDGSVLAMRSPTEAKAFVLDSNTWTQRGTTILVGGNLAYATMVAISDDGSIFAIGSPYSNVNGTQSGKVQVFEWSGADWSQKGDDFEGSRVGELLGNSVALSANGLILAIGANGTTDVGINAGQAVVYAWPVPPVMGDAIPGPATYFSYFLPDGQECTSISPQRVQVGTFVELPGADALCQTSDDSLVAGWTIPVPAGFTGAGSSSLPLNPGHRVRVIESQRFTVVPFEPILTVEYDANIAADDACIPANMAFASDDGRKGFAWVPRADFSLARTWSEAPCAPDGYELSGWNTAGDGSGQSIGLGEPLPDSWESSVVNERRLFAVWRAS